MRGAFIELGMVLCMISLLHHDLGPRKILEVGGSTNG